jgi:hypothetical protein
MNPARSRMLRDIRLGADFRGRISAIVAAALSSEDRRDR